MVLRPNASRWKASAARSPPPTDALKPRLGARTGKRGNRRVVGEAPPHFILSQQRDAEIAANSESLAIGTQTHGRAIDRAVARIENRAVLVGEPVSAHAFDESQSEHRRVLLFALALGAAPLLWVFTARLRKNLDDLSFKLALALRDPKPSLGLAGIAELFPQAGRGRLLRPRRLRREARRRAQGHAKDEPEPFAKRITVGADKGFDTADFVSDMRDFNVTPHVAQNTTNRLSAIDGRTIRHCGYEVSQHKRKRVEEPFGWGKTIGGLARPMLRGVKKLDFKFTLTMAAYDLIKLPRLIGATA